jgi:hypothetical protein
METPQLSRSDDERDEEGEEELTEEFEFDERELDPDAFRTVDGAYSDEPPDPAMIAVIEAGGGVAEGFEQSEALLVDHAVEGDDDGTSRLLQDAFPDERESDPAVYGEADRERTSEQADE